VPENTPVEQAAALSETVSGVPAAETVPAPVSEPEQAESGAQQDDAAASEASAADVSEPDAGSGESLTRGTLSTPEYTQPDDVQ